MAHQRLLCVALLAALVFAPAPATALDGGFAGEECELDSDCMSRKCVNGACAATTCGLPSADGGVSETSGTFCTNVYTTFNPYQTCTFGYGQCNRAECCDTQTCASGVANADKSTMCATGTTFSGSRLCKSSGCAPTECCTTTQCDGPGGVPVGDRATYCPSGEMFDNVGICAGGEGACTSSECCQPNVRSCAVAFEQLGMTGAANCTNNSVLDGSRLYDSSAGATGGCCVTTTCATGIPDVDKATYCNADSTLEFAGVEPCPTGECTTSTCCRPKAEFCVGELSWSNSQCKCTDTTKVYVPGSGCVCGPGFYTRAGDSACVACPHGTYSAEANSATSCTACPVTLPYTNTTGAASIDACDNFCDKWLLDNTDSVCTNGGTCASLSGGAGSFSCSCPSTWMSATSTANNCDAPTTLLRLRALAASGLTLPNNLKLTAAYVATGGTPAYATAAPDTLSCEVATPSSTQKVPDCGSSYSLSVVGTGNEANTRALLNAKVQLATNYAGNDYNITWACSDGTSSGTANTFDIVLPGTAENNPNRQTLVCTALVRKADSLPLILVKLDSESDIPTAATETRAAQLTFVQSGRPICAAAANSTSANELDCPYSDVPYISGQPGTLGVSNIDLEKYNVTWSCNNSPLTTTALGTATSPALPAAGQTSLVCEAKFVAKRAQLTVTATSAATSAIRLTVNQTGMSEPCVGTIPAGASSASVSFTCPTSSLKSGTLTMLRTNAALTDYLVQFDCNNRTPAKSRVSADVTTSSADGSGAVTACSITISVLPPLLSISIVDDASAPDFSVVASQRAMVDACTLSATGSSSSTTCPIGQGMMPSLSTTLTPRNLDVNKYQIAWVCSGGSGFQTDVITNLASVVLDVNPNNANAAVDYPTVACTGTVTARTNPVSVLMVVDSSATDAGFNSAAAQLLVRQPHQSQACAFTEPTQTARTPVCPAQALKATAGTRTTLSTLGVNLSAYQVAWACVDAADVNAAQTTRTVSAGVAQVDTLGPNKTVKCTATITAKAPLLKLLTSGTGPTTTAWNVTARQSMQGRACYVATTAGNINVATVPECPIQSFLPTRSTVLATWGLDLSRWSVEWSCVKDGGGSVTLADARSTSNVVLANAKSVTLDKDANVGGKTITCTAAITELVGVLRLAATGEAASGYTLTAKQSTQTEACTVLAVNATGPGAVPECGKVALASGLSVDLGITGLGAGFFVAGWACTNNGNPVALDNLNGGAASSKAALPSGTTTCTANIQSSVAPIQLAGPTAGGVTFTARQGQTTFCTFTIGDTPVPCTGAAASTATTLSVAVNGNARPTFACTVGGNSVPVSRLNANSAIIMSPAAGIQMTCTVSVETTETKPIIFLNSNVPTLLKVEYFAAEGAQSASQTCASSVLLSKSLSCMAGTSSPQVPAGQRVKLSQSGLTAAGYYRWMCGSSAAAIVRTGTDSTATATVVLPAAGNTLSCNLMYWSSKPGFIRDRRMMM